MRLGALGVFVAVSDAFLGSKSEFPLLECSVTLTWGMSDVLLGQEGSISP